MGILRNHSHIITVQYSTVQYYIVQYYTVQYSSLHSTVQYNTQYTMTRTWVSILTVSLVLLACASAEEEQEGAVKASLETDTELLHRETREAEPGNQQRRQRRKKRKKEKMKKKRNMKKRLNKKGLIQIKKKKQIKRKKGAKKEGKVSEEASEGNKRILNKSERKKEEKFTHCDYLDLTEIGLRN